MVARCRRHCRTPLTSALLGNGADTAMMLAPHADYKPSHEDNARTSCLMPHFAILPASWVRN